MAPTTTEPTPSFRLSLSDDLSELAPMRRSLAAWLAGHGVHPEEVDELLLVADELCANAIFVPDSAPIEVEATLTGHQPVLTLSVSNPAAHAFTLGEVVMPTADATGGRGLPLVQALIDDFTIDTVAGRTTALVRKPVRLRNGRSPA